MFVVFIVLFIFVTLPQTVINTNDKDKRRFDR